MILRAKYLAIIDSEETNKRQNWDAANYSWGTDEEVQRTLGAAQLLNQVEPTDYL